MAQKIYKDKEVIKVIELLIKGKGEDKDIERWMNNELNGIVDLIFYNNNNLSPKEILQEARERNRPILL